MKPLLKIAVRSIKTVGLLGYFLYGCGGPEEQYEKPTPIGFGSNEPAPIDNQAAIRSESDINCRTGRTLTYENFGKAMVTEYCIDCHSSQLEGADRLGAPPGSNFDSHEMVLVWRSGIRSNTEGTNPPMPPSRTLTETSAKLLEAWLLCGAP